MSDAHFKIRLGRIQSPDGRRKFIRLASHLRYGSNRIAARTRSKVAKRNAPANRYFQRRVIVKFSLVKMTAQGKTRQAQHLDYIARETAAPERDLQLDADCEDESRLFDRDGRGVDVEAFQERGSEDPHQFRIIVSPEDSHKLESLETYTRDLMRQMEQDLGTRLDWVGAAHFDTVHPHAHIVLRGMKENGHKLIIPRRYIAHGLREQAERLISLELGPMPVKEASIKLARQVTQERLTGLDRALINAAENNIVDIGRTLSQVESWTRRLDIARLKFLSKMDLTEKLSGSQWRLSSQLERTLRKLGERGDILKAYHKALKETDLSRSHLGEVVYEPDMPEAKPVTGRVIKTGILDDVNDRAFAIVDSVSGQAIYVPIGGADNLEGIEIGDVVKLAPNRYSPKPSDLNIEDVAARNGRIYDMAAHLKFDQSARPSFLEAHIRRLEALRRARLVIRLENGSWQIPGDFLTQVENLENRKLLDQPVQASLLARGSLEDLSNCVGKTWLDQELIKSADNPSANGFGKELRNALKTRRAFLEAIGIMDAGEQMKSSHLEALEKRDLQDAIKETEKRLGKSFTELPTHGNIKGRYAELLTRPSGKYAVIERAQDFSLVPWREIMEKRRGMDISGQIRQGRVNWQFGRQKNLGR